MRIGGPDSDRFFMVGAVLRKITIALAVGACAVLPALPVSSCATGLLSDPALIIEKAAEAQETLKSFEIGLDVDMLLEGPSESDQGVSTFYHGEGSYERPDKFQMKGRSNAGVSEVISIGDRTYLKPPGSSNWVEKKPSDDLVKGISPDEIAEYLEYARDLKLVDRKGDSYHLAYVIEMGRYARAAGLPGVSSSALKGKEARMEVWVLKKGFYVKEARMEFSGNLTAVGIVGEMSISMKFELSGFNEPVSIEPPI